jgi:site-specific DNA recombinase
MTAKFAKKAKPPKWREGNKIVNYTRVSDPSQFDNTSLETQRKDAITFATKRSFEIKAFFGGEAESAKTDERKEFKLMLNYVRKHKEKMPSLLLPKGRLKLRPFLVARRSLLKQMSERSLN